MRAWALALVLAGCGFQAVPANVPVDAATDVARLDGTFEALCLGTFVKICVDPPLVTVMLTEPIDTGTSTLCAAYTSEPVVDACVITGESIEIANGRTITAVGTKPLILLSARSITISGTLDAASHRGKPGGPAADVGCPETGFTDPTRDSQGGGGWGGTFGTPGGNGGNGASGIGGIPPYAFPTTTLRGGCPGSDGADNGAGRGRGQRGHGGGAVMMVARDTITIAGAVNASGAGGEGGSGGAGGGGGGSGGMIVLEAQTVGVPGRCFANGGGGGEGGSIVGGHDGGESSAPSSPGSGADSGSVTGGNGGTGAFGTSGSLSGNNGSPGVLGDNGGGGAGGGGFGIITVIATNKSNTDDTTKVAPQPR